MSIEGEKGKEALKLEVGPPRPEEAREITELFKASWLATYADEKYGIAEEAIRTYWDGELADERVEQYAKFLEAPPSGRHVFVARAEGKVVGIMQLGTEGEANELKSIYALPEFFDKGVGRALWERGKPVLRNGKQTFVLVAVHNERAKEFYYKLDFRETGEPPMLDERLRSRTGIKLLEDKLLREAEVESEA